MIQTVCRAEAGRHVEGTVARSQDPCACGDCRWALVQAGRAALWGERVKRDPLARVGAPAGDARPKALGGDRGSGRIEARAGLILGLVEATPDITLEELRTALAARGVAVGYGSLWRFFARRRITRKKDRARGRAGEAEHPEATSGVVRRPARSRPRAPRLHRRDLGLHEHGPAVRTSAPRPAPAGQRASRSLENHHLRRRAAAHRPSRALRA